MSAPVDVLVVMELAYRYLNGGGDSLTNVEFMDAHSGMKEASAAVAELIEASKEVRGWIPHGPWFTDAPRAAVSRFDAALARVKGGAA